ncbi:cytochrome p450 3a4-like [Plakobranchus ocellatus]|uniref:Cytochrome p450 3a4-like n=1 Tax=Plakobranchus ocellatus TaxID=259542 RepID=A0AAV4DMB9_9GAST|nr:cytochrome p450 3a4-like [Plakobranchus ocellatus]
MPSDAYFNHILHLSILERTEMEKLDEKKPSDFLQSLVSAHVASDGAMTVEDLIGQSLLILFAAFDTTSTTLQFCFVLLALHPDIQERVYREIIDVCGDVNEGEDTESRAPSHEQLQHLHYMQQVIDETLRLFPPALFLSRLTNKTTSVDLISDHTERFQADSEISDPQEDKHHIEVGSNNAIGGEFLFSKSQVQSAEASKCERSKVPAGRTITIPAGASILIPVAKIHRDPRYYEDPENFDPDRFLPENRARRQPFAFLPFGLGPRQCIGMRMAYLEIKTALVYVLRKVRLEVNEFTEPPAGGKVALRETNVLVVEKPIKLAVKLR